MTDILLLSAGVGLGLWVLAVWLWPPRPALASLVAIVRADGGTRRPVLALADEPAADGWATRLGRPVIPVLRALGLPRPGLASDLAITGRSIDTHLADQATLALAGLLLPAVFTSLAALGGTESGWVMPAGVSIALAVAGLLLPELSVRAEAARRRAAFRHALSAYLDLVHILLAGGSGVLGALHNAADLSDSWSFRQLRRALTTAELTRASPWETLGQLGDELRIAELSELSAALTLAGTEGAKVRASLAAKAAALRARATSEAEAAATAANERTAFPTSLMALAFVLFIVYAAMAHISGSL
ncbi:secretion system protein [Streptomyces sp. 3MP-14]|uniref:Secretion system protein n=1 Tax=Streptomyces mimosae TaxID=2586635 RepID=A0A5N6AC95_9ACTN|nr:MULTISPECIES: type II secretion system F family protein [Streptomyces]KAB8166434.1 secretion system protein [Streptomyces mimosae]KAB8178864.1 secretion system protein [Streptomyces sp. 3MP-14]